MFDFQKLLVYNKALGFCRICGIKVKQFEYMTHYAITQPNLTFSKQGFKCGVSVCSISMLFEG